MKELTFDEYELLSDDEKIKYVEEMRGKRTVEEISKDVKEVLESIRKKRIRNKE